MEMVDCSFCGNALAAGTGKLYVKKDGTSFYFCTGKCEKNLIKLKRKPRRVRWTQEFQQIKKMDTEALKTREVKRKKRAELDEERRRGKRKAGKKEKSKKVKKIKKSVRKKALRGKKR